MKILLGDNQFFGINHADLNKAKKTKDKFGKLSEINKFIIQALDKGVNGFMINSNDLGFKVVDSFKFKERNTECHYSIPYPHKYASMVNESGILSLMYFVLKKVRFSDLGRVIKFVLTFNLSHLIPIILRLEIPKNLPKGSVIYIQNIVTDLILGLKNGDNLLKDFINSVHNMGYKAGLITLNPGFVRSKLENHFKHSELYMCFNMNYVGFNVFPSKNKVESEVEYIKKNTSWKLIAMSVMSSGKSGVSISESLNYIKAQSLDYLVIGSSNIENIEANIKTLNNE